VGPETASATPCASPRRGGPTWSCCPIPAGEARYTRFGFFCRNDGSRPGYPVHDYEAICFDPETDTTPGEARYVAEMAEARGWHRITLVTTIDQAMRARMLLGAAGTARSPRS